MNILIIGGVAAGTKTAAKLKRELGDNCKVTIITKSDDISYAGCGLPYYVGGVIPSRDQLIVNTPKRFSVLTGVEVRCGIEAVGVDRQAKIVHARETYTGVDMAFPYDKLVIAVGARSVCPPIEGVDLPGVFLMRTPDDAVRLREAIDTGVKRAVVAGGGFIGLEVAENLKLQGVRPVVIDMADQIMPGFDQDFAEWAENKLGDEGIPVFTGDRLVAIEGDGKVQKVRTENRAMKADAVILSLGIRPNTDFLMDTGLEMAKNGALLVDDHLQTNDPDIFAAGDCVLVKSRITGQSAWSPMGSSANMEGRLLAKILSGKGKAYPGVLGTAIVKLPGVNAAKTGLNTVAAKEQGYDVCSVTVVTDDKAHYYPGADSFIIRLIADRTSRKLLGVQALGTGEVDKVVDVGATAISLGAKVDELDNLDLCYAPPFSTAIHPFVTAVDVLINKLDGFMDGVTLSEAKTMPAGTLWVDVTESPSIPGCRSIPFTSINGPIAGIDPQTPMVLVCKKGKQAYLAQNRLKRYGYANTKVLEGGITFNPIEEE
ncbi:pyridine nucleotide-disulfide oxidoreductase [Anaerotruncus sp. AF02-27]|uniref:FAD-dependent oxidoreductase n=1 Tax=Anaerotruncus TaxID=244127 RepID=UPI000E4BB806|nr:MULTISPECIES: FAD-dependent oxidoreductase [Anaerotruncus]RGX55466.1 pyridine nucleotide-disulfide oxidoreductase [Anaerotruncus sp. AF02-27]